jgi:peptide/nickel transport system ATP-binding protein
MPSSTERRGEAPILVDRTCFASYPGKPNVISDVSVDVRKGDTVAVVGESGSGKSTLARVVMGLLPRSVGDVKFNGESLPPRLPTAPATSSAACR